MWEKRRHQVKYHGLIQIMDGLQPDLDIESLLEESVSTDFDQSSLPLGAYATQSQTRMPSCPSGV